MMQEEQFTAANGEGATRNRFSCALDLGWRMAELYALARARVDPIETALLPSHESLAQTEQLKLQADAVAGDAEGIGLRVNATFLLETADEVDSEEGKGRFRDRVCEMHLTLQRHLWRVREAEGKAYELGNALSDTFNLVAREESVPDKLTALRGAFNMRRVRWLDRLLGDLESRLGDRAVAVVAKHLHEWHDFVETELPTLAGELRNDSRKWNAAERELRSQTLIWRQLLTRDQQPEAYLNEKRRNEVRHRMVRRALVSYLRPVPIVVALLVLLGVLLAWQPLSELVKSEPQVAAVGAFLLSALGVSRAAVAVTLRTHLSRWSELLYSRALTDTVCEATLKTADLRENLSTTTRLKAAAGKKVPSRPHSTGSAMPRLPRREKP
ncbi:MAG: hypothetical protein LC808_18375 [Actinobacteria bacterium]|nr:hypothetical protein [Actinomycetota bacterium]